ncbi:MAG: DUF302 domain-containing protein [Thiobacillus sp.]
MSRLAMTALSIALMDPPAHAVDGMIALPSAHSAKLTMDKLESIARACGLKIFARIDHAADAASVGEELRPNELLIFGHPKDGMPLLQCEQTYGIDLPMRVLAWEDAMGRSWLGYKDPTGIGHNHSDKKCDAVLIYLTVSLNELVREAAGDQGCLK